MCRCSHSECEPNVRSPLFRSYYARVLCHVIKSQAFCAVCHFKQESSVFWVHPLSEKSFGWGWWRKKPTAMPGEEAGPAERKGSESTDTVQPEKSDTKVAGAQLPVTSRFNFKSVLWTFGRCLSALLPVYLAGYYRISTGLLVFGLTVYTGWKHARDAKEARLRSAMQSLEDGQGSQDGNALRTSQHFPGSVRVQSRIAAFFLCPVIALCIQPRWIIVLLLKYLVFKRTATKSIFSQ